MRTGDKPSEPSREFEPLAAPGLYGPEDGAAPPSATATVTETPTRPAAARGARSRTTWVFFALVALVFVANGFLTLLEPKQAVVAVPSPASPLAAPPAAVAPPAEVQAGPAAAPAPEAPPVEAAPPRRHLGIPAVLELSTRWNGLDLLQAGVRVSRPVSARWSVATAASPHRQLPWYGALFAADLTQDGALLSLSVVGPKPCVLEGWQARLFLLEPAHRPDFGSFDVVLQTERGPVQRLSQVYVDALTSTASSRSVVEGLSVQASYVVRVKPRADGARPAVLVLGARSNSTLHVLREKAYRPLDQWLLRPGESMTVTAVTGLSFVMPTVPAAPEARVTVEVTRSDPLVRRPPKR